MVHTMFKRMEQECILAVLQCRLGTIINWGGYTYYWSGRPQGHLEGVAVAVTGPYGY